MKSTCIVGFKRHKVGMMCPVISLMRTGVLWLLNSNLVFKYFRGVRKVLGSSLWRLMLVETYLISFKFSLLSSAKCLTHSQDGLNSSPDSSFVFFLDCNYLSCDGRVFLSPSFLVFRLAPLLKQIFGKVRFIVPQIPLSFMFSK